MNNSLGLKLILFVLVNIALFSSTIIKADNIAPEIQTQTNTKTTLFEESVENLPDLKNQLEEKKETFLDSMGHDIDSQKGLQFITNKNKSELQQESRKLEAISEHDLNARGQEEMIKSNSLNDLIYRDYSLPLHQPHMEYAKNIATGQDTLLSNLLVKLEKLGVECKTIKGDKRHEPEYFLHTKTTLHKDTIYNQTLCEELRNKYSCRDSLSVTCVKKGSAFRDWQPRKSMKIDGNSAYWNARHLGYAVFWKKKRYGWHIHQNQDGWRHFIAQRLKVLVDQIHTDVGFPLGARGRGEPYPVYDEWRVVFPEYEVTYRYREIYDICLEWKESWRESCGMQ